MSTKIKLELLKKYIKELIKKELDEASVTGNIDGGEGPPKTPYAFRGKRKKDKDKEKKIATNSTGYKKVNEIKFHVKTDFGSVLVDASGKGDALIKVAKALKGGRSQIQSIKRVGVSQAKQVDKKIESVNEADISKMRAQIKAELDKIPKHYETMKKWSGVDIPKANRAKDRMNAAKKRAAALQDKINALRKKESVNEGKYHDYRNDESLTAKQKIGYSMREVRDKLNELDKLVKMNVRLKNEVGVDSTSYWKRTHGSMKKISERLVKLANKVGQLY